MKIWEAVFKLFCFWKGKKIYIQLNFTLCERVNAPQRLAAAPTWQWVFYVTGEILTHFASHHCFKSFILEFSFIYNKNSMFHIMLQFISWVAILWICQSKTLILSWIIRIWTYRCSLDYYPATEPRCVWPSGSEPDQISFRSSLLENQLINFQKCFGFQIIFPKDLMIVKMLSAKCETGLCVRFGQQMLYP